MIHEIKVPAAGESITEAEIGTWLKNSGDIVAKDDVLVELETQKTNFELQSEFSGRLEVLKPDPQTRVQVGEVIATIDDSAAGDAPTSPSAAPSQPAATSSSSASEPILSPAARKMAAEKNVDPTAIQGSGRGGRIMKQDVAQASSASASKPAAATPTAAAPKPQEQPAMEYPVDSARGEEIKPASAIRRHIAKNLVAAQHTAAILTTFNEVDMSAVMAFRKKHKEAFKAKHGVNLGMGAFFAMASIAALKEFPEVNATFTGDSIIYRPFIDLSIAVSTEKGLVVPVMRNVDQMTIVDYEKALAAITEKAKARKLSIPDMTGGTFTISNGGVFGSMLSTPILNMPQSAILGLHKIEKRPVVVDDEIVIRPMMYLALSYDHRIIDGREAVLFLVKIKEGLEDLSQIINENDL